MWVQREEGRRLEKDVGAGRSKIAEVETRAGS